VKDKMLPLYIFQFLVIKALDLDPVLVPDPVLDPDPDRYSAKMLDPGLISPDPNHCSILLNIYNKNTYKRNFGACFFL
jgi:hypothetical protein